MKDNQSISSRTENTAYNIYLQGRKLCVLLLLIKPEILALYYE